MNRRTSFVLLSGASLALLSACAQPPTATATAAPAAPPPPVAAAPAPVAEPTPGDRWVNIRGSKCERLLELGQDDRAAASLFYIGYQAARLGRRTINVGAIADAERWAYSYCAEHPERSAVEAFRQAYRQTFMR